MTGGWEFASDQIGEKNGAVQILMAPVVEVFEMRIKDTHWHSFVLQ